MSVFVTFLRNTPRFFNSLTGFYVCHCQAHIIISHPATSHWWCTPTNCFSHAKPDIEISDSPPHILMRPQDPWIHIIPLFCQPLILFWFNPNLNIWFNSYYLNIHELGMPRYFILLWRKVPALASRFACFLDLRVTTLRNREMEKGIINIGNFH